MTDMAFKTKFFTIRLSNIENGSAHLSIVMNNEFETDVTADDAVEMINKFLHVEGATSYYLDRVIDDMIESSKKKDGEEE